jgi:hypothetical protein
MLDELPDGLFVEIEGNDQNRFWIFFLHDDLVFKKINLQFIFNAYFSVSFRSKKSSFNEIVWKARQE